MFLSRALNPLILKNLLSSKLHKNITKTNLSIMHTSDVQQLMRLVFRKSILSVNPPDLVQREIFVLNNQLHIREQSYDLQENCYLVGFGKCVVGMASKVEQILGKHLRRGIISIPHSYMASNRLDENNLASNSQISVFEGAMNNLPDEGAELASKEIKNLVENLNESDIVLVLISGGGSSLLTLPKPPVTLNEKLKVIKMLAGAGANIIEINTVRKKLSLVKGGGLASLAFPSKMVSLILSDVIGDPLHIIASGPTVVSKDDDYDALKIVDKYGLTDKIPSFVLKTLSENRTEISENNHVQNVLIGNNRIALEAAARECTMFGFSPVIVSDSVSGSVSEVADLYMQIINLICKLLYNKISLSDFITDINPILDKLKVTKHVKEQIYSYILSHGNEADKFCMILGGEPTVKVVGDGKGGRNQELALTLGIKLHEIEETDTDLDQCDVIFLSGGTDGIDGPTSAAGALTYTGQIKQAIADNLDPYEFLKRNDSFNFYHTFSKGKDHIVTGHTGVNVMDIHILIIQKKVLYHDNY